jgi:hypothetical protein
LQSKYKERRSEKHPTDVIPDKTWSMTKTRIAKLIRVEERERVKKRRLANALDLALGNQFLQRIPGLVTKFSSHEWRVNQIQI